MKRHPKTYKQFINWMYKVAMRRAKEQHASFKIFQSIIDGKLESVCYSNLSINYLFGQNKHAVRKHEYEIYLTCDVNLNTHTRYKNDPGMRDKEIIAITYAWYTKTEIPTDMIKMHELRPGMIFIDNSGTYEFMEVRQIDNKRYYTCKEITNLKTYHFEVTNFQNCELQLYNFYGNSRQISKLSEQPSYVFNDRQEFTDYLNKRGLM